MKMAPFLGALACLAALPALAFTARQENVLENLGGAAALARACPVVALNEDVAAVALDLHGIALERGASEMADRARRITAGFGAVETRTACAAALVLYGPEGAIPNLIVPLEDPT